MYSYYCKYCGCPVEKAIGGELVCSRCRAKAELTSEQIEQDRVQAEFALIELNEQAMLSGLMFAIGDFEFDDGEGVSCCDGPPCFYYRWHGGEMYTANLDNFSLGAVKKARGIVEQQIAEDEK